MLLKEDFGDNTIGKIVSDIKKEYDSGNNVFDKTVGSINYWSAEDKDGVVFIESKGAYATVVMPEITDDTMDEIIADIKGQLEYSDEDNQ
jgi:hypothetical protein